MPPTTWGFAPKPTASGGWGPQTQPLHCEFLATRLCTCTGKILSGLHALKAEYVKTEALMSHPENVPSVQRKLKLINNNFDELLSLCCFIRNNEIMPGSTSQDRCD